MSTLSRLTTHFLIPEPRRVARCRGVGTVLLAILIVARSGAIVAQQELPTAPGQATESLSVQDAVDVALKHNPELSALAAQADAMREIPDQAGALPDPMLSLNVLNVPVDTFDLDQEPMTQLQVGITQVLPYPGKRRLQRAATVSEAVAADAMLEDRRSGVTGQVRVAWWRLLNVERALEIVQQNKVLLRDFVDIAQTKYAVGSGLQQEVLLAQLELSRLLDRELQLEGARRGAQAELNALMNRPADQVIVLPMSPRGTNLPVLPLERQLLEQAAQSRALIKASREMVEAGRSYLDVARREYYPDFRIGVGYGFRQGRDAMRNTERPDLLSVMFSVNVPLYAGSKQSRTVEQRRHELARRDFMLSDTLRKVESAVMHESADYNAARAQAALLKTAIVPQAQQTVAAMLAAYQVNEVDFLNVISTQITLYNAQINYWDALSRAKQSLARLAAAVGSELLYE